VSWWTISVPDEDRAHGRRAVDLNADVGEAADAAGIAVERALLGLVTSAHIACGGHAGDEASMRATVLAARDNGVRVGAHPSYPDREGFGRRAMEMTPRDLASALAEQVGALIGVATSVQATVQSVKPHGALYGEVAEGTASCDALLGVMLELCGPGTFVVLPAGAPAVARVRAAGLNVLQEGFADRAYRPDGELVARQVAGSVFSDPAQAAIQARGLAVEGTVRTDDGTILSLAVDTLCIHGDSPHAVALADAVVHALRDAGVVVRAPSIPHG
jgi:5-oxoprolinase (ATP-hydrolysing) subunit A